MCLNGLATKKSVFFVFETIVQVDATLKNNL